MQDESSNVSDAVLGELVKQTGDLGNYVIKSVLVIVSTLSALISGAFAWFGGSDANISSVPLPVWILLALLTLFIWASMLHLAFVHVRASNAIANFMPHNPRIFFTGDSIFFSPRLLQLSLCMLRLTYRSQNYYLSQRRINLVALRRNAIPTASVAILEGFFILSCFLGMILVIILFFAALSIYNNWLSHFLPNVLTIIFWRIAHIFV